jgi:hypothetical protein
MEDINDFLDSISDYIDQRYFTIYSLKKSGFTHPILDIGFDDVFYEQLIESDDRFAVTRLGKYLKKTFCQKSEARFNDMLHELAEFNNVTNIDELFWIFKDKYNIEYVWSNLRNKVAMQPNIQYKNNRFSMRTIEK